MIEKIKSIFKTDFKTYNQKFRDKYIPDKYNQIELVDYLHDDSIDHYISISNRTDGKSFNYIHYFIDYSIKTGIGFILLARHYTVRFSYQKLIEDIVAELMGRYDQKYFYFVRHDFYILVGYKDKEIGIITDLNQATDLKYLSNFLKHYPIMIYDEFLALESDYLPDEWERLKTIYSSVNRKEDIPYIKYPKIFYLGNAVNFSSPVLANLDIFNKLEDHKINTVQIYDNVALEMRRNDNVNESRNLRAFKEEDDKMTAGEFEINDHNIANEDDRKRINKNKGKVTVKTMLGFLNIFYNRDSLEVVLSYSAYESEYQFNTHIKDNTKESVFLSESFYDEDHLRKYDRDLFKFDNQYSKTYVLEHEFELAYLKIHKIIGYYENSLVEPVKKEKQFEDNYIERTKKNLLKKFF